MGELDKLLPKSSSLRPDFDKMLDEVDEVMETIQSS